MSTEETKEQETTQEETKEEATQVVPDEDFEDDDHDEIEQGPDKNFEALLQKIDQMNQNQNYLAQQVIQLQQNRNTNINNQDTKDIGKGKNFQDEWMEVAKTDGEKAVALMLNKINELETKLTSAEKMAREGIENVNTQSYANLVHTQYPDLLNPNTALYKKTNEQIAWMQEEGLLPRQLPKSKLYEVAYKTAKKIDSDYRARVQKRSQKTQSNGSDSGTQFPPSYKQSGSVFKPSFVGTTPKASRPAKTNEPQLDELTNQNLARLSNVPGFSAEKIKQIQEGLVKNIGR